MRVRPTQLNSTATADALARFGVVVDDASPRPSRAPLRVRALAALAALAALVAALLGTITEGPAVEAEQVSTPDNARHCIDTLSAPYHNGCALTPLLVSPANGATFTYGTPTFTGTVQTTAGTGTADLSFWICTDAGCTVPVVSGTAPTVAHGVNSSWTTTPLAAGTYYWKMREIDNTGSTVSGWTAIRSFTVSTPGNTTVTVNGDRAGTTEWRSFNAGACAAPVTSGLFNRIDEGVATPDDTACSGAFNADSIETALDPSAANKVQFELQDAPGNLISLRAARVMVRRQYVGASESLMYARIYTASNALVASYVISMTNATYANHTSGWVTGLNLPPSVVDGLYIELTQIDNATASNGGRVSALDVEYDYESTGVSNTAPNNPASLAQYRSDGTTAIAGAAWTNQTTVVMKFNMQDADASETLTPYVEVSTTGAFSGACGTAGGNVYAGTPVAAPTGGSPVLGTVTVPGMSNSTTWYWRACVKDAGGAVSSWVARGGSPDFRLDATAPSNPSAANVFDIDLTATADVDWNASTTALSASWNAGTDTGGSGVRDYDVCFSTASGTCTPIAGTAMQTGNTTRTATATASGMTNGTTYYTCVRTWDVAGSSAGTWRCSDGFVVDAVAPSVPALVTPGAGAATPVTTPSFTATYVDGAPAQVGSIEFRVGTSTTCGTGVVQSGSSPGGTSSGANASWTTPALANGTYHWCARNRDAAGNTSAWSATRQLEIGPASLSFTIDSASVALGGGTIVTGADAVGTSSIDVGTNNLTGYTLTATDPSDSWAAEQPAVDTVPDWTGTGATPTVWAAATSGYFGVTVLSATGGKDTGRWGSGSTSTDFVNNRYAGLKTTPTTMHARASFSTGTDTVVVSYRVNASAAELPGAYTSSITYSLVANP